MSIAGYTIKPCHGCGSKKEHKKDSLCSDCLIKFKKAEEHDKMVEKLIRNSRFIPVYIPKDSRYNFTPGQTVLWSKAEDVEEIVEGLFFRLIDKLTLTSPKDYVSYYTTTRITPQYIGEKPKRILLPISPKDDFNNMYYIQERYKTVYINEIWADILDNFYHYMVQHIKNVGESAYQRGKSLLMQLHTGEITLDEFDKKE